MRRWWIAQQGAAAAFSDAACVCVWRGGTYLGDGRVLRVGERTRRLVAEAGDVLVVAAKVRLLRRRNLEGAEAVIDHLPDHVIVLHRAPELCVLQHLQV
jgi:hypothetical protein